MSDKSDERPMRSAAEGGAKVNDKTEVATGHQGATQADAETASPPFRPSQMPAAERYKVLHRLGKGGMGEVMAVRDQTIGREVALKRIRKANPSERLMQRFMREAGVQGRLEHPAIVPLYDIGWDASEQPYFTMKKLSGTTLSKLLETDHSSFGQQRLLRAFAEVCLAVEYAHVRGVIHRDLKPDNIVLGDFGEVHVLDWGVAKVIGEPDGDLADITSGSSDDNEHATIPGTVIGTPGFMAPEQVRGVVDVDARTDVYALGCILFQILTRQQLHPTGKAGLASAMAGTDARPTKRTPDRVIPPELDELCVAATEIDRETRIQTARELGERVQRYLDGDRDLATRKRLAADHLALAQAAFAAGDAAEQRKTAMREAASALALDPELTAAAELLGRLMLEPPRTIPDELKAEMLQDDIVTMQSTARVGGWGFVAFLAFLPLMWWIAPSGSPYLLATAVLVIANMTICFIGARVNPLGLEPIVAFSNAALIAVLSRAFTPLFIAPALAAMTVMAIVFTPTESWLTRAYGMATLLVVAVLGPFALERMGYLDVTTTIDQHGLLMKAPIVAGDDRALLVAALYVVALICSASFMANRLKARERVAKRHLRLQAWQLRHLVTR